jgi:ABC-type lipoprotein release transport system permease subunit
VLLSAVQRLLGLGDGVTQVSLWFSALAWGMTLAAALYPAWKAAALHAVQGMHHR